jgi:hypothetical protein
MSKHTFEKAGNYGLTKNTPLGKIATIGADIQRSSMGVVGPENTFNQKSRMAPAWTATHRRHAAFLLK